MRWTAYAAAYAIYILIALRAVFGKINASTEHAAYVGVPLIKATLHNSIDKGAAMEEHALVGLQKVLLGNLLAPMRIPLPQLTVLHLLYLQ